MADQNPPVSDSKGSDIPDVAPVLEVDYAKR